jgi:hypothetical protein
MAMVVANPSWLGQPENDRLELKSADALKHRETIVRAVVALLNHKGGQVIVGVDDRGVPEGREDLGREVDSLQNALLELIEPRPIGVVDVQMHTLTSGEVIEITVAAKRGRPLYAERRHGLYGFWMRSGPTTRALNLTEARDRLTVEERDTPQWQRWDKPLAERGEQEIVLVVQAELTDALENDALRRVFEPAGRTALSRRDMGWTVVSDYDRVERSGRKYEVNALGARKWLSCNPVTRTIRFEGRADFLQWRSPDAIKEPVIYPFPLIEGIASFLWLLKAYGAEAKPSELVYLQVGIWRPEGFRMGPQRPDSMAWQWPTRWTKPHDNTNVERSAEVDWRDIAENPDRVAHPFVIHVYEDFGYDADAVPFWVEADQRFVFGT